MRGREVAIGKALRENGVGRLAVQSQALRLLVLFIPREAQPAQPLEDGLNAGLGVALEVGVIQAQHHGSVVVAGGKTSVNERAGGAPPGGKPRGGGRKDAAGW